MSISILGIIMGALVGAFWTLLTLFWVQYLKRCPDCGKRMGIYKCHGNT